LQLKRHDEMGINLSPLSSVTWKECKNSLDERSTPKLGQNMYVWLSGIWFVIQANTFILFAVSLKGYLTDDWLFIWPTDDVLVV